MIRCVIEKALNAIGIFEAAQLAQLGRRKGGASVFHGRMECSLPHRTGNSSTASAEAAGTPEPAVQQGSSCWADSQAAFRIMGVGAVFGTADSLSCRAGGASGWFNLAMAYSTNSTRLENPSFSKMRNR